MTLLQTIDLLLIVLGGLVVVTWLARLPHRHRNIQSRIGTKSPSVARWGGEAVVGPVLGYLTGYGLVMTLAGASEEAAQNQVLQLVAGSGAHVLGAIVCLWIAATQFEGGMAGFLFGEGKRWDRSGVTRWAAFVLVAMGLCPLVLWLTVNILSPFMPSLGAEQHPTLRLLHGADTPTATILLLWLAAVVIAPLAEELFFRGILQHTLRNWYGDSRWAIAVTSAVFALVHAGQPATLPAIYLLSVLLGYLYERNANLLSPILLHALFNARTMLWETLA